MRHRPLPYPEPPVGPDRSRRTGPWPGALRRAALAAFGVAGLLIGFGSLARGGRWSTSEPAGLAGRAPVAAAEIGRSGARRPGEAPASPAAWLILDDFEDSSWPDPNLWQVSSEVAPTWWPSSCRARSGSRALWAFGGRIGTLEQPCGAGAPLASRSTLFQRLDLRGAEAASRLDLYFDLWLQMPPGDASGLFIFLHVPQPDGGVKRVPIFGATGLSGSWAFPSRKLDLLNLVDITAPGAVYDLRGAVWRLEWVGLAPEGSAPGAGLYIDDLILAWEPDPGITPPTPRPSAPPPSATPSASPTRVPSATPSLTAKPSPSLAPSATPIAFGRTFLPLLVSFWPPAPTATATPTLDPLATHATETALALTPTQPPSPGPSPTATPSPTTAVEPGPGPPIRPSASPTP